MSFRYCLGGGRLKSGVRDTPFACTSPNAVPDHSRIFSVLGAIRDEHSEALTSFENRQVEASQRAFWPYVKVYLAFTEQKVGRLY